MFLALAQHRYSVVGALGIITVPTGILIFFQYWCNAFSTSKWRYSYEFKMIFFFKSKSHLIAVTRTDHYSKFSCPQRRPVAAYIYIHVSTKYLIQINC